MIRVNSRRFDRIGTEPPPARIEVSDLLRDTAALGLTEDLRAALNAGAPGDSRVALRAVRDLVYELAGAGNRELAVDVLIHATGLAEFDCLSLRDYACKHGITAEGFRQHVHAMQRRLNLPRRSMQHADAN